MHKEVIKTENAPQPIGPYSQAIKVGNMLYVSGQIPLNPTTGAMVTGDIKAETKQVMENIKGILTEAKTNFDSVVKVTIFCTDLNDFAAINEMYGSYFTVMPPARETVQVVRLPKDARVEISVIVLVP